MTTKEIGKVAEKEELEEKLQEVLEKEVLEDTSTGACYWRMRCMNTEDEMKQGRIEQLDKDEEIKCLRD